MNGQDAFEHVVDRLCEAEKRAATAQEAQNGSRHEVAALQQTLNNVRSELTTTKLKLQTYDGADEPFIALYDAITTAEKKLRETGCVANADALKITMTAAKKFIDPIPF